MYISLIYSCKIISILFSLELSDTFLIITELIFLSTLLFMDSTDALITNLNKSYLLSFDWLFVNLYIYQGTLPYTHQIICIFSKFFLVSLFSFSSSSIILLSCSNSRLSSYIIVSLSVFFTGVSLILL